MHCTSTTELEKLSQTRASGATYAYEHAHLSSSLALLLSFDATLLLAVRSYARTLDGILSSECEQQSFSGIRKPSHPMVCALHVLDAAVASFGASARGAAHVGGHDELLVAHDGAGEAAHLRYERGGCSFAPQAKRILTGSAVISMGILPDVIELQDEIGLSQVRMFGVIDAKSICYPASLVCDPCLIWVRSLSLALVCAELAGKALDVASVASALLNATSCSPHLLHACFGHMEAVYAHNSERQPSSCSFDVGIVYVIAEMLDASSLLKAELTKPAIDRIFVPALYNIDKVSCFTIICVSPIHRMSLAALVSIGVGMHLIHQEHAREPHLTYVSCLYYATYARGANPAYATTATNPDMAHVQYPGHAPTSPSAITQPKAKRSSAAISAAITSQALAHPDAMRSSARVSTSYKGRLISSGSRSASYAVSIPSAYARLLISLAFLLYIVDLHSVDGTGRHRGVVGAVNTFCSLLSYAQHGGDGARSALGFYVMYRAQDVSLKVAV